MVIIQAGGGHLTIRSNEKDRNVRIFCRNTSLGRKNENYNPFACRQVCVLEPIETGKHSECNAAIVQDCNFLPSDIPCGNNYPSRTTMAEYAYCGNNPVNYVDIDGKEIRLYNIIKINEINGKSVVIQGLSSKTESAMKDIMKTTEGRAFFAQNELKGKPTTTTDEDHKALKNQDTRHQGYRQYKSMQEQLQKIDNTYIKAFEDARIQYRQY